MNLRTILTAFLFLFFASAAFAQDEYVGQKKQSIDSAMNAGGHKLQSNSTTTDTKLPVSTYRLKTGPFMLFYYDAAEVCIMTSYVSRRADYETFVEQLKKRYTEQSENVWVRNDNKIKATVLLQQSIFAVKFLTM